MMFTTYIVLVDDDVDVEGSHISIRFLCLGRLPCMARKLRIEYPGAIYPVR